VGVKNAEDPNPANHRWKGRIVLGGDAIKTSTGDYAIFADIGSVPSTMTAARIAIACACLIKDSILLQSDCVRAYIQADMSSPDGTITFVEFPRAWWPPAWLKMKRPVAKLLKALYGHPRAGDLWQAKLDNILKSFDFVTDNAWPGVYYKPLDSNGDFTMIVVYVDDLLIIGTKVTEEIMTKLKELVVMEPPTGIDKYLGCFHHVDRRGSPDGHQTTTVGFDMTNFLKSAVKNFLDVSKMTLKPATTPYVPTLPHAQYEELIGKSGILEKQAPSLVMKLMYAARMATPNIMVAVGRLASELSRWTAESDRKLLRLYSYVHCFADLRLRGTLSTQDLDSLILIGWPDADFNSDPNTSKSHSGCWIELSAGSGNSFPLHWYSKRQESTATHTCEAETVSLATCMKDLIPIQELIANVLSRDLPTVIKEDNSAARIACTKGYSPAMRYLKRTQRVSLGFISDHINDADNHMSIEQAPTATHRGDMFTKELNLCAFAAAVDRIGMRPARQP
jgi:hypothetical protein